MKLTFSDMSKTDWKLSRKTILWHCKEPGTEKLDSMPNNQGHTKQKSGLEFC